MRKSAGMTWLTFLRASCVHKITKSRKALLRYHVEERAFLEEQMATSYLMSGHTEGMLLHFRIPDIEKSGGGLKIQTLKNRLADSRHRGSGIRGM